MRRWFAMSAIGRDRPGIVADLAELIYECDCNLEDSRMTILGSEFAVLLLLSGQGDDVERPDEDGEALLPFEPLAARRQPALDEPASAHPPRGVQLECVVTGVDKAGIVARVARTIADHGANITDLHSDLRPEPESGTPMYTLRLRLIVPPERDVRVLRQALERVASELRVDLSV